MDLDIGGDVADLDIDALLSRVNELHAASEAMNVLPTQKELDQLENTSEKESTDGETMRGLKKPKSTSIKKAASAAATKKRDDEKLLLMSDDDDDEDLDDEIEAKDSLSVEIASIEAELEKQMTKETIKGKKGKGEGMVLPKTRRVIKSAANVRTERAMRIARGRRLQLRQRQPTSAPTPGWSDGVDEFSRRAENLLDRAREINFFCESYEPRNAIAILPRTHRGTPAASHF